MIHASLKEEGAGKATLYPSFSAALLTCTLSLQGDRFILWMPSNKAKLSSLQAGCTLSLPAGPMRSLHNGAQNTCYSALLVGLQLQTRFQVNVSQQTN